MLRLLIVLFIMSFFSCKKIETAKKPIEQLQLDFHPSFHPYLDFKLTISNSVGILDYKTYRKRNPATGIPEKSEVYDSFRISVRDSNYLKFINTIRSLNFKHKSLKQDGLDGIMVYVKYISTVPDTSQFEFWSPNRTQFELEYKLLDAFFEFSEKTFIEPKQAMYFYELKRYFDYNPSENDIINALLKLPEVENRKLYIEKQTHGTRHLKIWIHQMPEETEKGYYWVKVGEDNGTTVVTHLNFFVNQRTLEIDYYDIENDKNIDLETWRKKKIKE
jgi:hypothetical protein